MRIRTAEDQGLSQSAMKSEVPNFGNGAATLSARLRSGERGVERSVLRAFRLLAGAQAAFALGGDLK